MKTIEELKENVEMMTREVRMRREAVNLHTKYLRHATTELTHLQMDLSIAKSVSKQEIKA